MKPILTLIILASLSGCGQLADLATVRCGPTHPREATIVIDGTPKVVIAYKCPGAGVEPEKVEE